MTGPATRPRSGSRTSSPCSPPACAGSANSCRRPSPRSPTRIFRYTEKLPGLGNNWGPRVSLAIGDARRPLAGAAPGLRHVLRPHRERHHRDRAHPDRLAQRRSELLHAALRTIASTARAARRRFPTFLPAQPASVVKPGAVEFAPNFRNPEVHQAVAAIEEPLPGHVELTASAMLSLGRRLPVSIDTNLRPASQPQNHHLQRVRPDSPHCHRFQHSNGACGNLGLGPIKAAQITVPFYASWPASTGGCRLAQPQLSTRSTRLTRSRAEPTPPMRRPWSGSRATAAAA